jgi:hypothetical protein
MPLPASKPDWLLKAASHCSSEPLRLRFTPRLVGRASQRPWMGGGAGRGGAGRGGAGRGGALTWEGVAASAQEPQPVRQARPRSSCRCVPSQSHHHAVHSNIEEHVCRGMCTTAPREAATEA